MGFLNYFREKNISKQARSQRAVQRQSGGTIGLGLFDDQGAFTTDTGILTSGTEARDMYVNRYLDFFPKHDHRVVRSIRNEQRPDGSWEIYYEAPQGDVNTTVECYAALRAAGVCPHRQEPVSGGRGKTTYREAR